LDFLNMVLGVETLGLTAAKSKLQTLVFRKKDSHVDLGLSARG